MTDQPIDLSGFHAKDGLFFTRLEHGDVEVRLGDSVVVLGYSIWASVVAAVSAEGETAVNYQTARWFHMGPNSVDHPARKPDAPNLLLTEEQAGEPAEQPEPAPEQAKARAVARELLRIIPEAIRADIARGVDDDDNRLLLAEVFEAARPLVGNPVARPLVLPVAKLAQRMYAAATAEQPNVQLDDRLDTRERCPSCSRPATSIRDQGGDGLTVARKWLPCGCTRIVPVGGDRG